MVKWGSLSGSVVKNLPAMKKTLVQSLGQRRKRKPTPVFLPGEFHGQSLAGYSPRGRKESDTTELTACTPAVSASKVTTLPGRLMDSPKGLSMNP